jgi:hypothetical protein
MTIDVAHSNDRMPRRDEPMSADLRLFLGVTLPLATFGLINQASRTVMAIIGPVLAVEFSLSGSELGCSPRACSPPTRWRSCLAA